MHVVVIGGGITGLAAARVLAAVPGIRVTVLEAADSVGGKLQTSEFAGHVVDDGAEQVLVRTPEATGLIRELGLGDDIVHPRTSSAAVWTRGRLRALPSGTVLGVPAAPAALARSGLLSGRGLLRAGVDLLLPRSAYDADATVGGYVRARVGREVVDRLVDPLLGGVYAGRADALSLEATLPQLAAQVGRHRTLLGAARAARAETPAPAGPVFASLRGGLGRLPAVLAASMDAHIRSNAVVRVVEARDEGFRLTVGGTRDPEQVDADAVVVATPARPAGRMLADVAASAAAEIGGIDYASNAIVTLAYRRPALPAQRISGFLVPAVDGHLIKAVTFSSVKWPHLDAGQLVIVRASVGRYGEPEHLQRDDDDIVDVAAGEIAAATGVAERPVERRLVRWGGSLPQYLPGHLDRVRRARAALPARLAVAGAAYDGVGVPACIRSGQEAARSVLDQLRQSTRGREEEGA